MSPAPTACRFVPIAGFGDCHPPSLPIQVTPADGRNGATRVIAGRSGERPLTEPIDATRPWQRGPLFMPRSGHQHDGTAMARSGGNLGAEALDWPISFGRNPCRIRSPPTTPSLSRMSSTRRGCWRGSTGRAARGRFRRRCRCMAAPGPARTAPTTTSWRRRLPKAASSSPRSISAYRRSRRIRARSRTSISASAGSRRTRASSKAGRNGSARGAHRAAGTKCCSQQCAP